MISLYTISLHQLLKAASIWHIVHVDAAGIAWQGRLAGSPSLARDVGHRVHAHCPWEPPPVPAPQATLPSVPAILMFFTLTSAQTHNSS